MLRIRGAVVHCGRYGCVVRLEDGRLAMLSADAAGVDAVRRAAGGRRRPLYPFVVEDEGKRLHVRLADAAEERSRNVPAAQTRLSSSLEQKIIDFWRQTAEWDRSVGMQAEEEMPPRAERFLPFAMRARRQYREQPVKRGRRPKR